MYKPFWVGKKICFALSAVVISRSSIKFLNPCCQDISSSLVEANGFKKSYCSLNIKSIICSPSKDKARKRDIVINLPLLWAKSKVNFFFNEAVESNKSFDLVFNNIPSASDEP